MTDAAVSITLTGYGVLVAMAIAAAAIVQATTGSMGAKIIWAHIRMTVQLVAMGFVLIAIFQHPHPLITVTAAAVMVCFAVMTVVNEHKATAPTSALWRIGVALAAGSTVTCIIFVAGVVAVNPLVNPRYLLPLLGMILGNSMSAMNIAVRDVVAATTTERPRIETALYLGATKKQALSSVTQRALQQSLTPTMTTMMSLGIVMIPGMMTGQLLSGSLPMTAVAYQLAIMVGIFFSVVISTKLALDTAARCFLQHIPD